MGPSLRRDDDCAAPAPCQSGSGLFTLYLINQTIKSSD
jgi:hypothetical protein